MNGKQEPQESSESQIVIDLDNILRIVKEQYEQKLLEYESEYNQLQNVIQQVNKQSREYGEQIDKICSSTLNIRYIVQTLLNYIETLTTDLSYQLTDLKEQTILQSIKNIEINKYQLHNTLNTTNLLKHMSLKRDAMSSKSQQQLKNYNVFNNELRDFSMNLVNNIIQITETLNNLEKYSIDKIKGIFEEHIKIIKNQKSKLSNVISTMKNDSIIIILRQKIQAQLKYKLLVNYDKISKLINNSNTKQLIDELNNSELLQFGDNMSDIVVILDEFVQNHSKLENIFQSYKLNLIQQIQQSTPNIKTSYIVQSLQDLLNNLKYPQQQQQQQQQQINPEQTYQYMEQFQKEQQLGYKGLFKEYNMLKLDYSKTPEKNKKNKLQDCLLIIIETFSHNINKLHKLELNLATNQQTEVQGQLYALDTFINQIYNNLQQQQLNNKHNYKIQKCLENLQQIEQMFVKSNLDQSSPFSILKNNEFPLVSQQENYDLIEERKLDSEYTVQTQQSQQLNVLNFQQQLLKDPSAVIGQWNCQLIGESSHQQGTLTITTNFICLNINSPVMYICREEIQNIEKTWDLSCLKLTLKTQMEYILEFDFQQRDNVFKILQKFKNEQLTPKIQNSNEIKLISFFKNQQSYDQQLLEDDSFNQPQDHILNNHQSLFNNNSKIQSQNIILTNSSIPLAVIEPIPHKKRPNLAAIQSIQTNMTSQVMNLQGSQLNEYYIKEQQQELEDEEEEEEEEKSETEKQEELKRINDLKEKLTQQGKKRLEDIQKQTSWVKLDHPFFQRKIQGFSISEVFEAMYSNHPVEYNGKMYDYFFEIPAILSKDINIKLTNWDTDLPKYYLNPYDKDNIQYLDELLKFDKVPLLELCSDHPVRERVFFMPKYSQQISKQQLYVIDHKQFWVESTIKSNGFFISDHFFIKTLSIFNEISDNVVIISAYYETQFLKYTVLESRIKSVIALEMTDLIKKHLDSITLPVLTSKQQNSQKIQQQNAKQKTIKKTKKIKKIEKIKNKNQKQQNNTLETNYNNQNNQQINDYTNVINQLKQELQNETQGFGQQIQTLVGQSQEDIKNLKDYYQQLEQQLVSNQKQLKSSIKMSLYGNIFMFLIIIIFFLSNKYHNELSEL